MEMLNKNLTYKEIAILRLISEGHTHKEIASELDRALGTVRNEVYGIIHKLGAKSQTHAVAIAITSGILMW